MENPKRYDPAAGSDKAWRAYHADQHRVRGPQAIREEMSAKRERRRYRADLWKANPHCSSCGCRLAAPIGLCYRPPKSRRPADFKPYTQEDHARFAAERLRYPETHLLNDRICCPDCHRNRRAPAQKPVAPYSLNGKVG